MKQPFCFLPSFSTNSLRMRSYIFPVLLSMLFSCSKNEHVEGQIQGKWQLVKIRSVWTNTTTEGSDLDRQEFYVFRNDFTFLKSRQLNGEIIEMSGVYSWKTYSDGQKYLSLTFEEDSDIIYSCQGDTEALQLAGSTLSNNSWAPCDGPILEYRKVD